MEDEDKMAFNNLMKRLFSSLLHKKVISIGTSYFATNELETDYVSLINLTKTMLVEIQPAQITKKGNLFFNECRLFICKLHTIR